MVLCMWRMEGGFAKASLGLLWTSFPRVFVVCLVFLKPDHEQGSRAVHRAGCLSSSELRRGSFFQFLVQLLEIKATAQCVLYLY